MEINKGKLTVIPCIQKTSHNLKNVDSGFKANIVLFVPNELGSLCAYMSKDKDEPGYGERWWLQRTLRGIVRWPHWAVDKQEDVGE